MFGVSRHHKRHRYPVLSIQSLYTSEQLDSTLNKNQTEGGGRSILYPSSPVSAAAALGIGGPLAINHTGKITEQPPLTTTATTTEDESSLSAEENDKQSNTNQQKYDLTLLLIDHYDSFTYNLYDMLAQMCINPPIVLAKDSFQNWSQVVNEMLYQDCGDDTKSTTTKIDGIILSPGPGTPTHPDDIGTLSPSIIRENPNLPIMGVCLGHQIMGHVYGAKVDLCGPVHGQVRPIDRTTTAKAAMQFQEHEKKHDDDYDDPLWKDIPTRFNVTRYHSLAVTLPADHTKQQQQQQQQDDIPALLQPTAYSGDHHDNEEDRILMGMSHMINPHYGVQFHPESIGSEYGHQLIRNFCDICSNHKQQQQQQQVGAAEKEPGDEVVFENPSNSNGYESISASTKTSATNASQAERIGTNNANPKSKYQVLVHRIPSSTMTADLTPLEVFEEFLSEEQYSVWLDTSIGVQSTTASATDATGSPTSSYSSIMGAGRNTVEYFGKEYDNKDQQRGGLYCNYSKKDCMVRSTFHDDILTYLQQEHAQATDSITLVDFGLLEDDGTVSTTVMGEDTTDLPFDFRGGHVGYLGYEVRHDSERFLEEEERGSREKWKPDEESLLSPPLGSSTKEGSSERTPTAAFLFLDKSWVYDHSTKDWYLLSLVNNEDDDSINKMGTEEALEWMRSTAQRMKSLTDKNGVAKAPPAGTSATTNTNGQNGMSSSSASAVKFTPNRSRVCYNQNFADCQEQIRLGESYELCLTNQLEAHVSVPSSSSPLELYKVLRKRNPAPFSAFLNWNSAGRGKDKGKASTSSSLAVCCSSPERFVSVKRMGNEGSRGTNGPHNDDESIAKLQVEAKPIKGTCARVIPNDPTVGMSLQEAEEDRRRAAELQESVKNRAENLMIVDLLRNDLSRVCEVGSVHVSKLMDIESYATVHQMVSTIRGTLDRNKANSVDVLKATFPGGSMTGAPKIRTMEILERLEEGVSRGPYAGCLGYISMNGSMDMNIVIRSAVLTPNAEPCSDDDDDDDSAQWKVSIGAGGAITALSESTDEYEEMILKASAVMKAVQDWAEWSNEDNAS